MEEGLSVGINVGFDEGRLDTVGLLDIVGDVVGVNVGVNDGLEEKEGLSEGCSVGQLSHDLMHAFHTISPLLSRGQNLSFLV